MQKLANKRRTVEGLIVASRRVGSCGQVRGSQVFVIAALVASRPQIRKSGYDGRYLWLGDRATRVKLVVPFNSTWERA